MKKSTFILSVISFIFLSSCQDLDQDVITTTTYEQVTESYNYTKTRNSAVYATLLSGFNYIDDAMMASATDEAEHSLGSASVQKFNNGSVNPNDNPDDVWGHYFEGIRRANNFLVSSDNVNLDLYKNDPSSGAQETYYERLSEIDKWKKEVRFLRAYFYFELVKRYGGVPLITDAGLIENAEEDISNYQRKSLAECIKFIVDECDATAMVLPVSTSSPDLGRATKGAALALKSRALLYIASDLYNDSSWADSYGNPELISVTGDRSDKWQAAADAAKEVIDIAPEAGYSLSGQYADLFGPKTFTNKEVIFCVRNSNSNAFELNNIPIGYDRGLGLTTPSQNLVDSYEVKVNETKAVPFDWNNPDHAANPYSTSGSNMRDPRLSFTVLYNNVTLKGRPLEVFKGGLDGQPKPQATKTGYYLSKYVNSNLDLPLNQTSNHAWVIFRLGEIYLNYAEALNEVNPGHPDVKSYIDKVRMRKDVDMPPLPNGLTQSEMREKIRHERRVELAFEDHRFWDLKRWKVAPAILGSPLRGVEITRNQNMTFNYNLINIEDRSFESKMYFYPIPQSEIIKTNLPQNPLW